MGGKYLTEKFLGELTKRLSSPVQHSGCPPSITDISCGNILSSDFSSTQNKLQALRVLICHALDERTVPSKISRVNGVQNVAIFTLNVNLLAYSIHPHK